MPLKRKTRRNRSKRLHKKRMNRKSRKNYTGGGLSNTMPVTTWGKWESLPGSTLWGPSSQAPPPLANGGLYTNPQSTGVWASQPFPATQYALAAESATLAKNPDIFYHQRPTTSVGNSWSPYVGQAISNQHWSARMPTM